GTCEIELEVPGRLKSEPAVFGGATGAEVLVEVSQRVLPLDVAMARIGGNDARLSSGPNASLISECALSELERSIVESSAGKRVREVLEAVIRPEFAAVLVVLQELGVIEVVASVGKSVSRRLDTIDPLDEEAVRKRISARLALIEEGDYFEVLGVPRSATSYEIRRAYLEARRAFEPSRLLTARTAELVDDARLIVEVLDEAYELLRDETRRERYRRAVEAVPP
ncbi:MAG: DnaJ domain-containing protein, partial [Polyangiaceae bacterium]|nr:DnaJ domain-containing protein [Polyangiaceae bacterium]